MVGGWSFDGIVKQQDVCGAMGLAGARAYDGDRRCCDLTIAKQVAYSCTLPRECCSSGWVLDLDGGGTTQSNQPVDRLRGCTIVVDLSEACYIASRER